MQVSCSLADAKTRRREVRALEAAMPLYGVNESWIVTREPSTLCRLGAGCLIEAPEPKALRSSDPRTIGAEGKIRFSIRCRSGARGVELP